VVDLLNEIFARRLRSTSRQEFANSHDNCIGTGIIWTFPHRKAQKLQSIPAYFGVSTPRQYPYVSNQAAQLHSQYRFDAIGPKMIQLCVTLSPVTRLGGRPLHRSMFVRCGYQKPCVEESRPLSQEIVVVGLDLAKNVFQVHAIDAQGQPIARRQLRGAEVLKLFSKIPPCLVGLEACASAHY
jgi:hypothetical protein